MIAYLNTKEDLDWLFEVHLASHRNLQEVTLIAEIIGNEDCPDEVRLYYRNHYDCVPTILEPYWSEDDSYAIWYSVPDRKPQPEWRIVQLGEPHR